MNSQQAAARIVDKYGLPDHLTPFLARLVPRNADATEYLAAAVKQPKHEDLVPFLGYHNQLVLRLSVLAAKVVDILSRKTRLTVNQYEELITEALGILAEKVV